MRRRDQRLSQAAAKHRQEKKSSMLKPSGGSGYAKKKANGIPGNDTWVSGVPTTLPMPRMSIYAYDRVSYRY